MYITIWLVKSSLSFYPITSQREFYNRKTQLCQGRTQWCQQITVQEHIFGEFAIVHLTCGFCTSATDIFPFTYHPFIGPGMCAVENFQKLRFGNSQSPDKFTENPKRTTITKNPPMGRRISRHAVGEDGMTVGVKEERGIGGIFISSFYGPRKLWMRPIPFTTLLTCASLVPRPTGARQLQKWRPIMLNAIMTQWGRG